MENRRVNFMIFAMFAVILIAFIGSTLFYSWINTESERESLVKECDMTSARVFQLILDTFSFTDIITGSFDAEALSEAISETDLSEDIDIWLVDQSGHYYLHNDSPENGMLFLTEPYDFLNSSILFESDIRGSYETWIGKYSPFLLTQEYLIIRPLYMGRKYLILRHSCASQQARQRQQFAQSVCMDLVLLVILLVLGTNIISSYRRQVVLLATTDELTRIANRKFFTEEFSRITGKEEHVSRSLFLLDIDYFKQINDRNGHAAGDAALRCLSEEIIALMQRLHGFAGRWGGDEFIGIVPLNGEEAYSELQGLCRKIEETTLCGGIRMTISVGITACDEGLSLSRLSDRADKALYASKNAGRNTVTLFSPALAEAEKTSANQKEVPESSSSSVLFQAEDGTAAKPPLPDKTTADRASVSMYLKTILFPAIMSAVRWMVPFVAGGGILIALAFLFDAASINLASLPLSERANFGSITPLSGVLKTIGNTTFNFMLPVFAGFLSYGIAGEEAFMAGFVGGFLTIESNAGFVGAMIAGFAAGVLTEEIKKFTGHLPKYVRKAAPILIYPVFSLLLMQTLSRLVITPISSFLGRNFTYVLEQAFLRSRVLSGGFAAMMMAMDMGGIINKAAYTYGVSGLSAGHTILMASVMIGGMVPPVGIFLSMLLFKKKYTEEERSQRIPTLFMGLSFITEAALPFVFTDFLRIIPCCMAGSALSGALSSAFGCTLPAPHGGIFVFPVMGHPLLYVLSLLIGSLFTAVLLGVWKKEKTKH